PVAPSTPPSLIPMQTITTQDGTRIFYEDWGSGEPVVFSQGWPHNADAWDAQMLVFVQKGVLEPSS
ncbi:alpha/beta fold hydrolase, partial [Escherichia coli]|uniref:alpha/beta fold hydrolase n=1 Tax=Escherichia coli TaxID=562 RepID=UPI0039E049A2